MKEVHIGDKVRLIDHSDPREVFEVIGLRAHGKLADLSSPRRRQVLCAPLAALIEVAEAGER